MAARAKDPKELLGIAGRYMVLTEIPLIFRSAIKGPPLGSFPRSFRAGGQLLRDTGRILASIAYLVTQELLRVGSPLVFTRIHNEGGVIRPTHGRFLCFALSPPLTPSEARTKGPRDFPGAFPLIRGPEGPGIYRKTSIRIVGSRKRARQIERIFAFSKVVRIPRRRFLYWRPEALKAIARKWAAWIKTARKTS
ncbi:MAG: hypothetical protein ABIT01_19595 [Thermoanaerobaculia bacterium]